MRCLTRSLAVQFTRARSWESFEQPVFTDANDPKVGDDDKHTFMASTHI